jgi:hypothetical protein
MRCSHRAHQRVLHDVLSVSATRDEPAREAHQPRAIPRVQGGERVIAAGGDQIDQRALIQRGEHAGREGRGKCVDGGHRM